MLPCAVPAALADTAEGGPSPPGCAPLQEIDPATGSTITKIFARARAGVPVAPEAIEPPALVARRPALIRVRLGPDPLGIAATLGIAPSAFWGSAGAHLATWGPGFYVRSPIAADGSSSVALTPPRPGSVRMRMYVPGTAILAALGTCSLTGWGVGSPLVRPGEAPGAPVLEVDDRPQPPPDPGGEPAP